MRQYLDLLSLVLEKGVPKNDRTGVGTISHFGHQMRFDLSQGFPIVTTKKVHFRSVVHELLWFISGDTNVKYLQDNNVKIWNAWADNGGDLGPVYGHQWRNWGPNIDFDKDNSASVFYLDQLAYIIDQIKKKPDSRRHVVTAWNPVQIPQTALPPCHILFQFYIANGKLSCHLYQRSADVFLGVPFNIASYALLTHMVAQVCDLDVGDFIHSFGDVHIYQNHIEQVKTQLERTPYLSPTLQLNPETKDVDQFKFEDIELVGYKHHPHIKAEVAV